MKSPDDMVRKDMISRTSMLSVVLRALYSTAADYILIRVGSRDRLMHKEQLVALMEQGRDDVTTEDLLDVSLKENVSAPMDVEDVPQSARLLIFEADPPAPGELVMMTFGEYREARLAASSILLPAWWSVPLPLVYVDEDQVLLNPFGESAIPGGAVAMARQIDRMRADRIVTIKDSGRERTLSLSPLGEGTYLIEDISGDYEMAEDLVWWAAVGRAFLRRLQDNGLEVRRLSPFEEIPSDASEVISCRWDNELVGRIAIKMPAPPKEEPVPKTEQKAASPEAKPATKTVKRVVKRTVPKSEAAQAQVPASGAEAPKKKVTTVKKVVPRTVEEETAMEPPTQSPKLDADTIEDSATPKEEKENLRRSAAKNAYGIKSGDPSKDQIEQPQAAQKENDEADA